MKVTSNKQIAALLKEYPLIRDACIRFDLRYVKTIEARNATFADCLEEIHIGRICIHNDNLDVNFNLYFYDGNSLYLGKMESKRKTWLSIFWKHGPFHDIFTKENMFEALQRIHPVREPMYALRTDWSGYELLLLKTPSNYSSLWELASTAVANREKIQRKETEQAEREVKEALKKEFGEER